MTLIDLQELRAIIAEASPTNKGIRMASNETLAIRRFALSLQNAIDKRISKRRRPAAKKKTTSSHKKVGRVAKKKETSNHK